MDLLKSISISVGSNQTQFIGSKLSEYIFVGSILDERLDWVLKGSKFNFPELDIEFDSLMSGQRSTKFGLFGRIQSLSYMSSI